MRLESHTHLAILIAVSIDLEQGTINVLNSTYCIVRNNHMQIKHSVESKGRGDGWGWEGEKRSNIEDAISRGGKVNIKEERIGKGVGHRVTPYRREPYYAVFWEAI